MEVIREELEVIRAEYGDVRRTEILDARLDLTLGDMIPEEERVVTISHGGYAKTQPLAAYQAQRRGGKGKSATGVKDEDYIAHLLVANSHTTLLLFSSKGKVYWLKTYEIPEASRAARGRPLVNLLPLDEGEYITTMLPVEEYTEGHYIFMATANGTVKKTPLESLQPSTQRRPDRAGAGRRRRADLPRPSPMASAKSCCSPTAARSPASRSPTCAPWAVPLAVCAACVCRKGRS